MVDCPVRFGYQAKQPLLIYASGFLAGFGLLFNIVARAGLAIILLFALSHSDVRRRLGRLWPWVLGISLTIVPLFVVNGSEVLSSVFVKIVGPGSVHASEYESILDRISANAFQNILAFNYNSHTSHYVSGALLDPISAVLALMGLAYCMGTIGRASSRLMLIVFAVLAAGTALLSPYPHVPITRMSAMVIPLALMGGAAAGYLFRAEPPTVGSEKRGLRRIRRMALFAALGTAILVLNAWQFWYSTPRIFHHTQEAIAIGAMRSDACNSEPGRVIMIGRSTVPLLKPALESYHPDGDIPYLPDHSDAEIGSPFPAGPPGCFIFLNPEDTDIQAFRHDLPVRYPQGQFSVFSGPSGKSSVEIFEPFPAVISP